MLKPEARLVVLMGTELGSDAHNVGKLKGRREGTRLGFANVRQDAYPHARFHIGPKPSRTLDEAEHRRQAEFPDPRIRCLAFANIPVGNVRFAHNSEVETADFPPGPVRVPDHADIRLPDVMVGNPAGDLQTELIGLGSGRSQDQRTEQCTVERALLPDTFVLLHEYSRTGFSQVGLATNAASRHFRDGLKKVLGRVLLNEENAELSFVESRLAGKSCENLQISFGKFDGESVSRRATVREST